MPMLAKMEYMHIINSVGVFVFYCMMGYTVLVVLYVLFGVVQAIFVPSSRTIEIKTTTEIEVLNEN